MLQLEVINRITSGLSILSGIYAMVPVCVGAFSLGWRSQAGDCDRLSVGGRVRWLGGFPSWDREVRQVRERDLRQ